MHDLPRRLPALVSSLASLALLTSLSACNDDSTPGDDEIGDGPTTGQTADTTGDGDTETGDSGTTTTGDGDTTTTTTTADTTGDGDTTTTTADTTGDGDTTTADTTGDGDTSTDTGQMCGPECCPGEYTCEGNISLVCNEEGTDWEEAEVCDDIQGVTCSGNTGLCTGACSEQSLGLSYIGCDYYPTVTLQYDLYNTAPKDEFAVAVANTGNDDAMITITRGPNMVYDTVVPGNDVEVIVLPWVDAMTKGNGPSAMVVDGAYRLRSDRPIVVYQYNPLESTTTNDSSLLLPVNAWGPEVTVASWPEWSNIPAFYTVVAHEDGTTVTLSPPSGGANVQAGGGVNADGSGVIMLDNSDAVTVVTNGGDLTGSMVSADKPVQVIGGHKCTNVPANVSACDHLEEVLFPTQTLADHYIVVPPVQVPNDNELKAQMVRVIATEDNTTIATSPGQGIDGVLTNAGDFVQLDMTQAAFEVTADKPIMVVQYMVGQSAGFGTSDPAMVQAVTPAQFRFDYLFYAAPSWDANYVDIIAPDNASVTVDGANVGSWSAVGNSGYSVAHVQLSNAGNGVHTVDSDQRVGISVYGVRSAGSYWYPGGLDLQINPQ